MQLTRSVGFDLLNSGHFVGLGFNPTLVNHADGHCRFLIRNQFGDERFVPFRAFVIEMSARVIEKTQGVSSYSQREPQPRHTATVVPSAAGRLRGNENFDG
jgi:hypothetical protein